MARQAKQRDRTTKTAVLGNSFVVSGNETALIPEADMEIQTLNVTRRYAGHRFEESGDEFEAVIRIRVGETNRELKTDWYEREDPPGLAWRFAGYAIHILGSGTGRLYRDRRLALKVIRE